MANGDNPAAAPAKHGDGEQPQRKQGWRHRPSIRVLRREAIEPDTVWADSDRRDNADTRLPASETVHLGGLILAEAFTPSTASALYKALEDFAAQPRDKDKWTAQLAKGRSAAGAGGGLSLPVVKRPGGWVLGWEHIDPALPDGIDSASLDLFFPTPSLTMIVATFMLTGQAGDLSELLRADYHTVDFRMRVPGRFGQARTRIPWARPVHRSVSRTLRTAEDQKGLAFESLVASHAAACWTWLASRFPGRFSAERLVHPPTVRLLLTKESVPFKDHPRWFGPVGLAYAPEAWRSTDLGWAFKLGDWPRDWRHDDRFTATAAARREDAASAPGRSTIFTGGTVWALTEGFADQQSSVVACWAITCVMSLYADQLARLRDEAGKPRRVSRPVRQALDLDRYLIRDGLDASTVASDLRGFTMAFVRDVPKYSLDLDDSNPAYVRARTGPRELIPSLQERIRNQAGWLIRDMEATTGHIRASAELRQAIANTRLQRRILVLTVVTIAIAVISVVVALRTAGHH